MVDQGCRTNQSATGHEVIGTERCPIRTQLAMPADPHATNLIYEVSRLLNCPLDKETLATALELLDQGANPEALAAVITELYNEARRIKPVA